MKKPLLKIISLLILLAAYAGTSQASEPTNTIKEITIVCDDWPNFCEKSGEGFYFELLDKIYSAQGITVHRVKEPFKRALISVSQSKYDIMPAAFLTPDRADTLLFSTTRISTEYTSILYKHSKQSNHNPINLSGIAIKIRGYDYTRYMTPTLKVIEVSKSSQAIEMLAQDRADYFMNDYFEITKALESYPNNEQNFKLDIFTRDPVYVVFPKTSRGEQLKAIFNDSMQLLYNNGYLKKLTEKYQLPSIYAYYPELEKSKE